MTAGRSGIALRQDQSTPKRTSALQARELLAAKQGIHTRIRAASGMRFNDSAAKLHDTRQRMHIARMGRNEAPIIANTYTLSSALTAAQPA